MKKYSKTHEWILVNNGIGIIGISKRAAEDLGDVTYVDLPEVGKVIEKGEQLCTIESVKATVVYMYLLVERLLKLMKSLIQPQN